MRLSRKTITALCAACALGGYSSQALAQSTPTTATTQPNAAAQTGTQADANQAKAPNDAKMKSTAAGEKPRAAGESGKMQGKLVKGSEMLGSKLFNQSAKHIGEIKDVLLDENTGKITHALLSTHLENDNDGITDVAVPFKHIKQSEKDSPGYVLRLDEAKLANAPAYPTDENAMFDDAWAKKNNQHFGDTAQTGIKLVRLSQVKDSELYDQQGNKIGSISDTLVYPNSGGKVAYGILDVDYVGENKLTSVPFSLIRQSEKDTPGYVLNVEKSQVERSELFERNEWPEYNDLDWNVQRYEYYRVTPYWTDDQDTTSS